MHLLSHLPTDWPQLLTQLSQFLLETDALEEKGFKEFTPEQQAKGTLMREGASLEEIEAAETRLGLFFPPSYRVFLQTSNGFDAMGFAALPGALWNTENIQPLREQDDFLTDLLLNTASTPEEATLGTAIAIADHGDACDLFLLPEVRDEGGEMQCWTWASWTPGETRYQTFLSWMIHHWKSNYLKWRQAKRRQERRQVLPAPPFGLLPIETAYFYGQGLQCGFHCIEEVLQWCQKTPLLQRQIAAAPNIDTYKLRKLLHETSGSAQKSLALQALLTTMRNDIAATPEHLDLAPEWVGRVDYKLHSKFLRQELNRINLQFEQTSDFTNDAIIGGDFASLLWVLQTYRDNARRLLGRIQVHSDQWTL